MVFQNESFDEDGYFEWCRFDPVWWVKTEQGEQVPSMIGMICDPSNIDIPRKPVKCRRLWGVETLEPEVFKC